MWHTFTGEAGVFDIRRKGEGESGPGSLSFSQVGLAGSNWAVVRISGLFLTSLRLKDQKMEFRHLPNSRAPVT